MGLILRANIMKKLGLFISVIVSSFILSGCFDTTLPKCDDKEVKSLLGQILNKSLKEIGEEIKFISSNNIAEEGLNKESKIRVCSTDIMFSDATEESMIYNIKWTNEKKGIYEVSIVDTE